MEIVHAFDVKRTSSRACEPPIISDMLFMAGFVLLKQFVLYLLFYQVPPPFHIFILVLQLAHLSYNKPADISCIINPFQELQ